MNKQQIKRRYNKIGKRGHYFDWGGWNTTSSNPQPTFQWGWDGRFPGVGERPPGNNQRWGDDIYDSFSPDELITTQMSLSDLNNQGAINPDNISSGLQGSPVGVGLAVAGNIAQNQFDIWDRNENPNLTNQDRRGISAVGVLTGGSSAATGFMKDALDVQGMDENYARANTRGDLFQRMKQFEDHHDFEARSGTAGRAAGAGALSGAGTGAKIGSLLGPKGAVVGGAIGGIVGGVSGFFGGRSAQRRGNERREQERQAGIERLNQQNTLIGANEAMLANRQRVYALGGDLFNRPSQSTWRNPSIENQLYTNNNQLVNRSYAYGGNLFNRGGQLFSNGGDFSNGVTFFGDNTGGTHEENPLGGIPQGIAEDGEMNFVEEGEVKWNDFIFSDRLVVPKDIEDFDLPKSLIGKSFADAAEFLSRESQEREVDPISQAGLNASLSKLAITQEHLKELEQEEMQDDGQGGMMFKHGGQMNKRHKINPMSNYYAQGGGIHIKKENRGKFTASANRAGMGVQAFARHVLTNKDDYSSTQVKRANFARNAASWNKAMGGDLYTQYAFGGSMTNYGDSIGGMSTRNVRLPVRLFDRGGHLYADGGDLNDFQMGLQQRLLTNQTSFEHSQQNQIQAGVENLQKFEGIRQELSNQIESITENIEYVSQQLTIMRQSLAEQNKVLRTSRDKEKRASANLRIQSINNNIQMLDRERNKLLRERFQTNNRLSAANRVYGNQRVVNNRLSGDTRGVGLNSTNNLQRVLNNSIQSFERQNNSRSGGQTTRNINTFVPDTNIHGTTNLPNHNVNNVGGGNEDEFFDDDYIDDVGGGGGAPITTINNLTDGRNTFLDHIGYLESGNTIGQGFNVGGSRVAFGTYQMTGPTLQDIGMLKPGTISSNMSNTRAMEKAQNKSNWRNEDDFYRFFGKGVWEGEENQEQVHTFQRQLADRYATVLENQLMSGNRNRDNRMTDAINELGLQNVISTAWLSGAGGFSQALTARERRGGGDFKESDFPNTDAAERRAALGRTRGERTARDHNPLNPSYNKDNEGGGYADPPGITEYEERNLALRERQLQHQIDQDNLNNERLTQQRQDALDRQIEVDARNLERQEREDAQRAEWNRQAERANWLRYAPVAANMGLLGQAIGSRPDKLQLGRISPELSGERMRYRPISTDFLAGQMRQQSAAMNRALVDQAGGDASRVNTLKMLANQQHQTAIGEANIQAHLVNEQMLQNVKGFNRDTEQFNIRNDFAAQQYNTDRFNEERHWNKHAEAARRNMIRQGVATIGTNLGDIGTENRWMAIAPNMTGYSSTGAFNQRERTPFNWRAKGGKLNKMYKRKIK